MISVGGINLVESIINLEYEMKRTQMILDWILTNNRNCLRSPTQEDIKLIDEQSIKAIQIKFPDAGIGKK